MNAFSAPVSANTPPTSSTASTYNQVLEQYAQANYLAALELARTALEQEPHDVTLLNAAATCARVGGLPDQAEYYWRLAVAHGYSEGYFNLGVLYGELGRYAEAETSYRQALIANPQSYVACNNWAVLLQGLQRYEEAESLLRDALNVNPNYVDANYNLGVLLFGLGRYEEAGAYYRQVLSINSAHPGALNNRDALFQVWLRQKIEENGGSDLDLEASRALAFFGAQRGMLPPGELVRVAEWLEKENQIEQATALYRLWLDNTPMLADTAVYFNIGIALTRMSDVLGAEQVYRSILSCDVEFIPAYVNLALSLQRQARVDEALALWRQLFGLDESILLAGKDYYLIALKNFALFLQVYYRPLEAEQVFKKSLALEPNQPDIVLELSRLQRWMDIGFHAVPRSEHGDSDMLADDKMVTFCLAHTAPFIEFPPHVKLMRLGRFQMEGGINLRDLAPEWEPFHPCLASTAGVFAIKNYLLAHPQYERVTVCSYRKFVSGQKIGGPIPLMPFQYLLSTVELSKYDPREIWGCHDRPLLVSRPNILPHYNIDSNLQLYFQQHHLEDLLRFLAEAVSSHVFTAKDAYDLLNQKLLVSGGGELGIYPAAFFVDVASKMERMVTAYLAKYKVERDGEQMRALSFCCERVGSYLVLNYLRETYPDGVPSDVFGYLTIATPQGDDVILR
ncbi:MAG: tetratricopeptide repeat protein [Methylococcaceae bacterium]|nr:MAG: tetratricopeptide repeat protein [Methylococcaceae bacterium]